MKAEIIARLQREILPLQGFKPAQEPAIDMGWNELNNAFPNATFPLGAVHEFLSNTSEQAAATAGFVSGITGHLMARGGACLWLTSSRNVFPPALSNFGIDPHRVIFVHPRNENECHWAMEEALKTEGLAAVIASCSNISLTASRRLQLAVEQSGNTGFLLRHQPAGLNPVATIARWRISPLATQTDYNLPGVGFPRWNVELLKIRNGKPGTWQLEWTATGFRNIPSQPQAISVQQPWWQQQKTG
ncbi:ImuA family protein [Filimonas effusa]|uniref:Error-prone repair protein ImuA n=1 Tax=Filimonas effusa TaxID=2508721 RepID=A0A4Q1D995_9BACT|nr:Error-prone repair protein ImuA [Filimonas effusa]RXK85944.1 Error-prone repair protein ImuA [Filimonas effusa]